MSFGLLYEFIFELYKIRPVLNLIDVSLTIFCSRNDKYAKYNFCVKTYTYLCHTCFLFPAIPLFKEEKNMRYISNTDYTEMWHNLHCSLHGHVSI